MFPANMKRGRRKGLKQSEALVRRIISKDDYERKYRKNNGQCRITIPRAIADLMNLHDQDVICFKEKKGDIIIEKVFGNINAKSYQEEKPNNNGKH